MGHKEELLEGAKKSLLELGFARTTARDIVARSGTNRASIGYHFGSKDALMLEAITSAMEDWGNVVATAPQGIEYDRPDEKFVAVWTQIIESFHRDRPLMVASFEALIEAEHNPILKQILVQAYPASSEDLPEQFLTVEETLEPSARAALGKVLLALISGVLTQYMVDPKTAPDANQLLVGLTLLGRLLGNNSKG